MTTVILSTTSQTAIPHKDSTDRLRHVCHNAIQILNSLHSSLNISEVPINKGFQSSEESMKSSEEWQMTLHYPKAPINKGLQPYPVKSEDKKHLPFDCFVGFNCFLVFRCPKDVRLGVSLSLLTHN